MTRISLVPLAPLHAAALQPLPEDPAIAATTPFPHPYPPDGAMSYVQKSLALREAGSKFVFAVCGADNRPCITLRLSVDTWRSAGAGSRASRNWLR